MVYVSMSAGEAIQSKNRTRLKCRHCGGDRHRMIQATATMCAEAICLKCRRKVPLAWPIDEVALLLTPEARDVLRGQGRLKALPAGGPVPRRWGGKLRRNVSKWRAAKKAPACAAMSERGAGGDLSTPDTPRTATEPTADPEPDA